MIEYGSEHHWQSREAYVTGRCRLDLEGFFFFRSGRDAMKQLAAAKPGSHVLLPALCCESMILPFALNGCKVEFYKLTAGLAGDEQDVLAKAHAGDILLYMCYFDHQPFRDEFLNELRRRGVFLLEDRTQDIIVPRSGGFVPDATVASLRKWAAMPEGGLLKTAERLPDAETDPRFAALRREAMEEKGRYLKSGAAEEKESFLDKFHRADELLDENGRAVAMGEESRLLLAELDFEKILSTRRRNVSVLERELADFLADGRVRALTCSRSTAGLYYPLLLQNRDAVQRAMAQAAIYCPVIWPIPAAAVGVCQNCENTAAHILALPCDQRYTQRDMTHIAGTLKKILS